MANVICKLNDLMRVVRRSCLSDCRTKQPLQLRLTVIRVLEHLHKRSKCYTLSLRSSESTNDTLNCPRMMRNLKMSYENRNCRAVATIRVD